MRLLKDATPDHIKTYHEAPISIFDDVQELTDGDYALVHLFEEIPEYFNKFKKAVEMGREVILDNSIFELGTAFDADKYAGWIKKLCPTYYVIPDVLENGEATVRNCKAFLQKFPDLPGKSIGVVQGSTYEDMCYCYKELLPLVDVLAFSFDLSTYKKYVHQHVQANLSDTEATCMGRPIFIHKMVEDGILDQSREHHLLGVALPQELVSYKQCHFIVSVDTSNPIVHGLHGIQYQENGLPSKITTKLYTLIHSKVNRKQKRLIVYNIKKFKEFCTR